MQCARIGDYLGGYIRSILLIGRIYNVDLLVQAPRMRALRGWGGVKSDRNISIYSV